MKTLCVVIFSFSLIFASIDITSAKTYHTAYLSVEECTKCHPRANPTHKMASPQRYVPSDMPLEKDAMACITCHNCISGTCILRRLPSEICQTCHDCTQGMACLIGIAHLGNSPNINDLIKSCTKRCHYGRSFGGKGEHKVNILYIAREGFRTIADSRVVLINNKITCISCHNPYESTNDRLSVPYEDNKLCLNCHIK